MASLFSTENYHKETNTQKESLNYCNIEHKNDYKLLQTNS